MGVCPEILPTIEILMSLYESSMEEQDNMAASLVSLARARIAQQKAEDLSQLLRSNLDELMARETAKMDATFLIQAHKETLIREACHFITYVNHLDPL